MGYIYKIENLINNKKYIGQSIYYPKERWRQEIKGYKQHNMVISKAIKKYGVENFTFEIIEEIDNELLDEREIYWIKYYDSYHNGYNSTKGGKSHIGYRIKYEPDFIVDYYLKNDKKSCRDVAKDLGIFHETVSSILKEKGIPIRKGKQNILLIFPNGLELVSDTYKSAAEKIIQLDYATCGLENLRKNIIPKKDEYNNIKIIRR